MTNADGGWGPARGVWELSAQLSDEPLLRYSLFNETFPTAQVHSLSSIYLIGVYMVNDGMMKSKKK